MLLLRLACLFFIYFVSSPLLAAEPITFFKTGTGKSTEEEVVDLSSLQVVVGDRLRLRIENYDDIVVTVSRSFISESENLVLSGEVSAFNSLTMVIGSDGTVVGSISTKENSFRLYSENGSAFAKWLDPFRTRPRVDPEISEPKIDNTKLNSVDQIDNPASVSFITDRTLYPTYEAYGTRIDLYIYYDKGLDAPHETIDYLTEVANYVFNNMLIDLEVRVVGKKKVTVSSSAVLDDLVEDMKSNNPPFDSIDTDISTTGADLVHFIVGEHKNDDKYCGLAQIGPWRGLGFRDDVSGASYYGGGCYNDTFIHELGHNLGSLHDRETDPDGTGAYHYSRGSRVAGEYRSVMAYGSESEFPIYPTFSWPTIKCGDVACGVPAFRQDSADNRRSITNVKRLVSAYRGGFNYAAIQEYPGAGTCDAEEPWRGPRFRNNSNYSVEIMHVAYLSGDSSPYYLKSFNSNELIVSPGDSQGWGFCGEGDDQPIGDEIKEAFYVYENPETGELIEGTHVFFDDNYSGDYAVVRAAAGVGGSVVGNPSLHAKVSAETEITFKPNSGYKLSSVSGTCPGSLHYNVYTAEPIYGDCWAIASFEPLEGVDLVQQHFTNLLQSVMSVRGAQSSSAKADASDPAVSSNLNQALR